MTDQKFSALKSKVLKEESEDSNSTPQKNPHDSNSFQKEQLKNSQLLNILLNEGVVHEANRTFFHPIGLNLIVQPKIQSFDIKLEPTDEPKGFVSTKLNEFLMERFRHFQQKKISKRYNILGFVIQTKDVFRQENIKDNVVIAKPSKLKINFLMKIIGDFFYEVQKRFMENHKIKDEKFIEYWDEALIAKIKLNIIDEDWISVASYCILLHNLERYNEEVIKLIELEKQQIQSGLTEKEEE